MKATNDSFSWPARRPSIQRRRHRRFAVELLEPRTCFSLSVPAFSSLPGANHTIYLDFDGHVTSGTTWNTGYYGEDPINSPAWSLDSDRANFSDTELATIERIWKRVAEDFSPFNVNVTTVEPPVNDLRKGEVSGDAKWGVRAVVSIETTTRRCGCGGIAYIGSFNDLYDEPVFIYNSSENGVAEAISHEVGHSLNLAHDGTKGADLTAGTSDDVEYYGGHAATAAAPSWAPIMGSSYSRTVTTWDLGEYYNTNNGASNANYGNGPDDQRVITTTNGFGYRNDDHGNTTATATALPGTALSASGIITTRTDVDVFSFTTGAGSVTLNVNPASISPNLDIQADLLDSAGNVVATSNPATALNASFALSLAAGTYYLRIDGVGAGTPTSTTPSGYTDYNSIGQYSLTGTVIDPGTLPALSVDDVSASESGGVLSFVVRLNGSISQDVTVNYATAAGTAAAGADYTTTSGTLTFVPGGPTTQTVAVTLANDGTSEPLEALQLVLSNSSNNALITDAIGVGTITNDDAALSINDVSATEGNVNKRGVASYTTATFTASLAHPVNRPVALTYTTGATGDTATANVDYQSASVSLSITAGQTSVALPVTVIGDNTAEPNEKFTVTISSSDTLVDGVGVGTIVDNDSGGGKGGRPRTSAANYVGDFTILDHTDRAESDVAESVVRQPLVHDATHDADSQHHESAVDSVLGLSATGLAFANLGTPLQATRSELDADLEGNLATAVATNLVAESDDARGFTDLTPWLRRAKSIATENGLADLVACTDQALAGVDDFLT